MSDWRNIMPMIVNKIRYQFFAKKLGSLEPVRAIMTEVDLDGNCAFSKEEFGKLLYKIGIFLTSQEQSIVFAVFDRNGDGQVSFLEFFEAIRSSMSDARISHVRKVFEKLDSSQARSIPLGVLIATFDASDHPSVRIKEKSVEQVTQEFQQAITAHSKDGASISDLDFLDYYADVSACLPNEREAHFFDILNRCWGLIDAKTYVSPERVLDLEMRVFEKVRQKTEGTDNEGVTLRHKFSHVDRFGLGVIDFPQFKVAMLEMGCCFQDHELLALFNKYTDGSPKLVCSEVCDYYKDLGVGATPNLNPTYSLYRSVPEEILTFIRRELAKNGYFGLARLRQLFLTADKNGNGVLSRDEFTWIFNEMGISLTLHDLNRLYRYFDKNFDNQVSYNEFIGVLSVPLSQNRANFAIEIYQRIAAGASVIDYVTIGNHFEPLNDPEIKAGYTTKNQLLNQLLGLMPDRKCITQQDWLQVVSDVSAQFEDDASFMQYFGGLWAF